MGKQIPKGTNPPPTPKPQVRPGSGIQTNGAPKPKAK